MTTIKLNRHVLTLVLSVCLSAVLAVTTAFAQENYSRPQTRRERIMAKLRKLQAEHTAQQKTETPQEKALADSLLIPQSTNFTGAMGSLEQQLQDSLKELSNLRELIAAEKIPLNRKLSDLEGELIKKRLDYQQTSRTLDGRTLDLTNLRNEIKTRKEEASYLSNLLGEYNRNFESRLHIAELQRYKKPLEDTKLSLENTNLSQQDIYKVQMDLVALSVDRLTDALGGVRFTGNAVAQDGLIKPGTFVVLGPYALFRSDDGKSIGTIEQRLGSLEPTVLAFEEAADITEASNVLINSYGKMPFDPTLGSAHKVGATKETLVEHIRKGGPVMVPILGMASAALLVGIIKWISFALLRSPSRKKVQALLGYIARHDYASAMSEAKEIKGPVGKMLVVGMEHVKEPRELIEEVMYEMILATRLKLQSWLPFIAISASSAPLLGLLGTVTGIINTFKMITVFGSGDVKTLSGGISEALITTEYGLIVAIPSLMLHAFLSRRARGIIDQMEKSAIAFINQVNKTPYEGKVGVG